MMANDERLTKHAQTGSERELEGQQEQERGQAEVPVQRLGQQQAELNYQSGSHHCLAIDTSTASMTVAVLNNGVLQGNLHTNAERNHSIGLLPNIQELLTSLGLKAKNLKAIAVGNGPGSYTGVRIGVTVGKTFAWSLGLDLVGVSSLEAMALGGRRRWLNEATTDQHVQETGQAQDTSMRWIIPLMDARRTQAFTAVYAARGSWGAEELLAAFGKENEQPADDASLKSENSLWRALVPDGIYLIQPWLEQLRQMAADAAYLENVTGMTGLEAPEQLIFVGETAGFENVLVAFQEQCEIAVHIVPHLMDAYDIGLLGHVKLAAGNLTDVHTFVPNYTQLPEAEVKLLAKSKKGED